MNKRVHGTVISLLFYLILINMGLIDLPRLGLYLSLAVVYPSVYSGLLKEGSMTFRIVFFALSIIIAIIAGLFIPSVIIQGGFS